MSYFAPIEHVLYQFGEADNSLAAFQNISAYSDVMDKFKESHQSYLNYEILDGDRPDVLSAKMYGDSKYYFTYYLMNDHIRRQGWPLTHSELVTKVNESHPNTTLVFRVDDYNESHIGHSNFRHDLVKIFKIGSVLEGQFSGATGTVVRKDLDLGHVIISGSTGSWSNGEAVFFDRVSANPAAAFDPSFAAEYEDITIYENAKLKSSSLEINSVHHYEDANGKWVDIDPTIDADIGLITPITHLDYFTAENNKLKTIKYLKPSVVREVYQGFVEHMSG